MASGCVPLFLDLDSLPAQTLALYPRQHLAAALRLPGLAISPAISISISIAPGGGRGSGEWYLQPAAFALDPAALRPSLSLSPSPGIGTGAEPTLAAATALAPSAKRVPSYWRLAALVLAHARRHLSSSAMAAHVTRALYNPAATNPAARPHPAAPLTTRPHTPPRHAP
jgi:hypothetical protein